MTDDFEQSMQTAENHAPAWLFEEHGVVIVGHVIGFGEFDAGWGPYPIVTLRLADGSERAVHCQREVLARELAKARPRIGERIGIKWLGIPEDKSYHRYVVRVDRPEGDTLDWSRYVPGVDEPTSAPAASVPVESRPAPAPRPEPVRPSPMVGETAAAATRTPVASDDDIPF